MRLQKLETVGVSYDTEDIFRLIETGWDVTYANSKMSASRAVEAQCDDSQEDEGERLIEKRCGGV